MLYKKKVYIITIHNNYSDKMNIKIQNTEDKVGLALFTLGIIFLLYTSYIGLFKLGVWIDEIYTLVLTTLPFDESFFIILNDVHPFLYYLILRIFYNIFLLFGFDNITVIGKFVSLIPFYLLGILCITKIKNNFGLLTAGLFFLCLCSMPRLMIYAIEVRMYSWALFFVTASLIYAYEIVKNPSSKNWLIFTVLTILSCYTHYFASISSFAIYIVFLAYILRKNKSLLKNWIISSCIVILSYIPWIFTVIFQISIYEKDFWIAPITKRTVFSYIYFVLSPANDLVRGNELVTPTIIGTLCLFAFIFLIYKYHDEFTLDTLFVFVIVPIIGIIISLTLRPFFHPRYFIPVLGCLWMAFSILLSKSFSDKRIFIPILCMILFIGVVGAVDFNNLHEIDVESTEVESNYLINNIGSGNIVISNNENVNIFPLRYYIPNNQFIALNSNNTSIESSINQSHIIDRINKGSSVYYLDSSQDKIQSISNEGYQLEEIPINTNTFEYRIYKIINPMK